MPYTPKMPRKRSRAKKKKDELTPIDWIKIVLFVVGAAALVSVFIFLRADIGNVADDYGEQASELNAGKEYSKNQFNKQFEYANEQKREEHQEANNGSSSGTKLTPSGDMPDLGEGKLITDVNINPKGLPIYDGWSHDGDSFYVDFSRFWESSDEMKGLGDFTSKDANNIVSYEGSGNSKVPIQSSVGQYNLFENRIIVALGPGITCDPVIYEPLVDSFFGNESMYTYSTAGKKNDWMMGTTGIVYKAGVMDNTVLGMWVDCVLEDGTVLALVPGDAKALHKGIYNNSEECKDYLLKGYGHWRRSIKNNYISFSIIECVAGGNPKISDLNLKDNKIVGFRCYTETAGRY